MKCPVCKSEIDDNNYVCPICNFYDLHKDFVNLDDAITWEKTVLTYYRALWARKQTGDACSVNLTSAKAADIFQRYFSETSHKYRLSEEDGFPRGFIDTRADPFEKHTEGNFKTVLSPDCPGFLEINTKFCQFTFRASKNSCSYCNTFGYDGFDLKYVVIEDLISIYLQSQDSTEKPYFVCTLNIEDEQKRTELLTVLEFMKAGDGYFTNPFDDRMRCWLELKDDSLTYDTYLHPIVRPLVFYAEVFSFSEDNDLAICNTGLCKISISVGAIGDEAKFSEPTLKKILESEEEYTLLISSQSVSTGEKSHFCKMLRSSSPEYNVFKNADRKSVYLGTLMEYTQFKFEDEFLMQQVFNYLTIILAHWDIYYLQL